MTEWLALKEGEDVEDGAALLRAVRFDLRRLWETGCLPADGRDRAARPGRFNFTVRSRAACSAP